MKRFKTIGSGFLYLFITALITTSPFTLVWAVGHLASTPEPSTQTVSEIQPLPPPAATKPQKQPDNPIASPEPPAPAAAPEPKPKPKYDIYTGWAPWGTPISIEVSPMIAQRFEITAQPHINALGTRIFVQFISKKVYSQSKPGEDVLEKIKADQVDAETIARCVRAEIIDTAGNTHRLGGDQFFQFIHADRAVELPNFRWKVSSKGIFALSKGEILGLKIWWDGTGSR